MFSSLLPGLRELRTPLTIGYLWLANIWVIFGGSFPSKKPDHGPLSTFWSLGDFTGKASVLAAISFAAYMIGSFVEFDPLKMWEHGGRPQWINRIRNLMKGSSRLQGLRVMPVTDQAERDVEEFARDLGLTVDDPGAIMTFIMKEEAQIATRLQASNADLYNKYDRLLSEGSFRVNTALPLLVLILLITWSSPLHVLLKSLLSIAGLGYSLLLFRQGCRKAIQSRDVIAQALSIGVIQSTYLNRRTQEEGPKEDWGGYR